MIKFYYGMSGAFKATTITAENKRSGNNASVVWSMIKPWKSYESGVFKNLTAPDHLNFAMLHLCNLESILRETTRQNILVERGVTDAIFYWLRNNPSAENECGWIIRAVEEELELCKGREVNKTLLVMKDRDFIENTILSEPSRAAVFPLGVNSYLEDQEKYIEFTKRYNSISNTVEITYARDYFLSLGLMYIDLNKILLWK